MSDSIILRHFNFLISVGISQDNTFYYVSQQREPVRMVAPWGTAVLSFARLHPLFHPSKFGIINAALFIQNCSFIIYNGSSVIQDEPTHAWNDANLIRDEPTHAWNDANCVKDEPTHAWNDASCVKDKPTHAWNDATCINNLQGKRLDFAVSEAFF